MNRQLQSELSGALKAVIDDMQVAIDELMIALGAEQDALAQSDCDALNKAGTSKQVLMLQLEQLDSERLQLSRESPAMATKLDAEWAAVVESLRKAQQMNLRNGDEVNQRLRQVRKALAVVTGHTGESGLYGRAGELQINLRSRSLAEA
ncbi:MAG: flagellar protein FlgN [Rhodanobacter sp.]